MGTENPEAVGLILVRIWLDGGRPVARVTTTVDLERDTREQVRYCASADAVCDVVTEFFASLEPPHSTSA